MPTIRATDARNSFFGLMSKVVQQHETYHISCKDGAAVLLSEEAFESLQETLALLSSKGFREDFDRARKEIKRGNMLCFEEVFNEPQ